MAKKQNKQSAQQSQRSRQTSNPSAQSRQRNGAARKTAPAQQPAKTKRTNKDAAREAATPGNILWRLSLILCMGLVIFSLLFASINGGAKYTGITYENDKEAATPTPPVSSVDPNVTITGSDATPIPPSPSVSPEAGQTVEGGDTQTVTP